MFYSEKITDFSEDELFFAAGFTAKQSYKHPFAGTQFANLIRQTHNFRAVAIRGHYFRQIIIIMASELLKQFHPIQFLPALLNGVPGVFVPNA